MFVIFMTSTANVNAQTTSSSIIKTVSAKDSVTTQKKCCKEGTTSNTCDKSKSTCTSNSKCDKSKKCDMSGTTGEKKCSGSGSCGNSSGCKMGSAESGTQGTSVGKRNSCCETTKNKVKATDSK